MPTLLGSPSTPLLSSRAGIALQSYPKLEARWLGLCTCIQDESRLQAMPREGPGVRQFPLKCSLEEGLNCEQSVASSLSS